MPILQIALDDATYETLAAIALLEDLAMDRSHLVAWLLRRCVTAWRAEQSVRVARGHENGDVE